MFLKRCRLVNRNLDQDQDQKAQPNAPNEFVIPGKQHAAVRKGANQRVQLARRPGAGAGAGAGVRHAGLLFLTL